MAGFTIERSANGKQFEAIGSVAVNNSFNLVNNYTFTDAHPLSTTSYYRLKINEQNGPATYSRTIPVKRQGKAHNLQVSPNPASNVLYVQIDAQEAITLQIADVTGHVVYQQSKTIKGNTTFPVSLQGLPAGNYYLIMKGKTIQKTQQFLKRQVFLSIEEKAPDELKLSGLLFTAKGLGSHSYFCKRTVSTTVTLPVVTAMPVFVCDW